MSGKVLKFAIIANYVTTQISTRVDLYEQQQQLQQQQKCRVHKQNNKVCKYVFNRQIIAWCNLKVMTELIKHTHTLTYTFTGIPIKMRAYATILALGLLLSWLANSSCVCVCVFYSIPVGGQSLRITLRLCKYEQTQGRGEHAKLWKKFM